MKKLTAKFPNLIFGLSRLVSLFAKKPKNPI
jgi:hypothetical protein